MPDEIGGDRSLWKPLDDAIQLIIDSDPRIRDLMALAVDPRNPTYFLVPPGGIMFNSAVNYQLSKESAIAYFQGQIEVPTQYSLPGYARGLINNHSQARVDYCRVFDDGVVQVAGFTGKLWESIPGGKHCWGLLGHFLP